MQLFAARPILQLAHQQLKSYRRQIDARIVSIFLGVNGLITNVRRVAKQKILSPHPTLKRRFQDAKFVKSGLIVTARTVPSAHAQLDDITQQQVKASSHLAWNVRKVFVAKAGS
jgi:hypothetical protein